MYPLPLRGWRLQVIGFWPEGLPALTGSEPVCRHRCRKGVHQTGLEPATTCLENRHSTIELLMRMDACPDYPPAIWELQDDMSLSKQSQIGRGVAYKTFEERDSHQASGA